MVPANPMMPPWAQPQPQQPSPVGPSPANVAFVEAAADSTAARMPSPAPRDAVSTGGAGDVTMHPVSLAGPIPDASTSSAANAVLGVSGSPPFALLAIALVTLFVAVAARYRRTAHPKPYLARLWSHSDGGAANDDAKIDESALLNDKESAVV